MPDIAEPAASGGFFSAVFKQQTVIVAVAAMIGGLLTAMTPRLEALLNPPPKPLHNQLPAQLASIQGDKWSANPTCGLGEYLWHPRQNNGLIDATICPVTGDILVSVRDAHGQMRQYWPALAENNVPQQDAVNTLFGSPAAASIPPLTVPRRAVAAAGVQTAQAVTCQVQTDAAHVRRRVHRPDGTCVDVTIDIRTGQVVSQVPIGCAAAC